MEGQESDIESLPLELKLHILQNLDVTSIIHLAKSSKRFQNVVYTYEDLWKFLCVRDFKWNRDLRLSGKQNYFEHYKELWKQGNQFLLLLRININYLVFLAHRRLWAKIP
jgi:hypothetical protein